MICQISSRIMMECNHLNLLASRSLSISSKTSPMRTGPFTFLIKCRLSASLPEMSMTFTCVIPPREPVLPRSWVTLALTGSDSMAIIILIFILFGCGWLVRKIRRRGRAARSRGGLSRGVRGRGSGIWRAGEASCCFFSCFR